MAFFRPSDSFVRADGLNLGSKFEYSFTNGCSDEVAIANDAEASDKGQLSKKMPLGS